MVPENAVGNLDAVDGIATLQTFLDEIWSALQIEHLPLSQDVRLRLDYLRRELLDVTDPVSAADGLFALGRQLERYDPNLTQIIAFFQFALQCDPHHTNAMNAALRRFRRLGRWSMVLKLLQLRSHQGGSNQQAHSYLEMARIYRDFYASQKGLSFALNSLVKLEKTQPLAFQDALWTVFATFGHSQWTHERFARVINTLQENGDRGVAQVLIEKAADQAIISGDLNAMLGFEPMVVKGSVRSVLLRLRATLIQRRVPEGLEFSRQALTQRAQLSLDALNQLLYQKGYFDHVDQVQLQNAWVLGWLFGDMTRSSSDTDRALQISDSFEGLRPLVHLVALTQTDGYSALSSIQWRLLAKTSQLLPMLRVQHDLIEQNLIDQFASYLEAQDSVTLAPFGRRINAFRRAEIFEHDGFLKKAAKAYAALFAEEPDCWVAWSSLVRVKYKLPGHSPSDMFDSAPLSSIDAESCRLVEAWIRAETVATTTSMNAEELLGMRDEVLGRALLVPNQRIWPITNSGPRLISLHIFQAVGWCLFDRSVTEAQRQDVLDFLPDDPSTYGLALSLLQTFQRSDDWIDEQLAGKFPQQVSTFLSIAERLIRKRGRAVSPEDIGDLGVLLSKHFEPALGHELVSLRAWDMALSDGEWVEAFSVWHTLVLKGVGCLSAELGLLCSFATESFSREEMAVSLSNVSSAFSNQEFAQIGSNWLELLSGDEDLEQAARINDDADMIQTVSALIHNYRQRRPEQRARWVSSLERQGCSSVLRQALRAHLADAQELGGDVLSALRTHQDLLAEDGSDHSLYWLLDWLCTNPDYEIATQLRMALQGKSDSLNAFLDLGHVFWTQQHTADAIRAFTKVLSDEGLRSFGLLELGSRLGAHGRCREAAQFYLELVRVTRSESNRRVLLEQALEWFEKEEINEKVVEVLLLLYQEHAGEYAYIARAKSIFIKSEKFHELADYFEQARSLSLASSDRISLELIGIYARTLNRPESARRVCQELMRRNFHLDEQLLHGLAEEMTELGLWDDASAIYEKIVDSIDVQSESFEGFAYRLASIRQEMLGDLAGARKVLESILEVRPMASEALERLAFLSCEDGSALVTARESLEVAIDVVERGQNRANLLLKLAELEAKHGDDERALKMRNAALSDVPGNLALVGTVVNDLVARGRGKEAGAALLKYELLNAGKITDGAELTRIRSVLKEHGVSAYIHRPMTLEAGEGGVLIVRQLLRQTSELFDGPMRHWLTALSSESPTELNAAELFVSAAQRRSVLSLTTPPKNVVLDVLSWLDSIFSVYPSPSTASTQDDLDEGFEKRIIRWSTLPIHTAYVQEGALHLSDRIAGFPSGVREFLIHYFWVLNELGGLVFTRWAKSELLGLAEEFCRAWFEGDAPSDKDRAQIHRILGKHSLANFPESDVTIFRQHLQLIGTLSEGVVGRALELALFRGGSVHAAFEAMNLMDESLEAYHRGGETLLTELLPRTMLRHQSDYETYARQIDVETEL